MNLRDFLVAQMVKNLPVLQESGVRSLGQEDPLEEGKAIHSSILAWRIPWTEENEFKRRQLSISFSVYPQTGFKQN